MEHTASWEIALSGSAGVASISLVKNGSAVTTATRNFADIYDAAGNLLQVVVGAPSYGGWGTGSKMYMPKV